MVTVVAASAASAAERPLNDDLADAIAVTSLPTALATHVGGATVEDGEQVNACLEMASTVWYALTLPAGGYVQVDTAGSDFDTAVVVFTGTAHENLDLVACANDTADTLQARVTFPVEAGVTYLVQVGASEFLPEGLGTLELAFRDAPRLTGRPTVISNRTADEAALAFWEEDIPAGQRWVKLAAANLTEHRRPGAPEVRPDVEVLVRESVVVEGVRYNDEWFGFVRPARGEFRFDPSLRTASVGVELELEHTRITIRDDEEEPEWELLPPATGAVDVTFTGVGPTYRNHFRFRDPVLNEWLHVVGAERFSFATIEGTLTVDGRRAFEGPPWQSLLLRGALHDTLWYRAEG